MRIAFAASLVVASLSTSAFSIGQYLPSGQNGISVLGSLDVAENQNIYGGILGYSYQGRFDVAFGYSRTQVEMRVGPKLDYGGNNYLASVMAHPVKQIGGYPIGLSLEAGFTHSTFGGGDLEDLHLKGEGDSYWAGGKVHGTQAINQSLSILVGAGYSWNHASAKLGDVKSTGSLNAVPVFIEGVFNLPGSAKVVFGPTMTFYDGRESLSLGMSLIRAL